MSTTPDFDPWMTEQERSLKDEYGEICKAEEQGAHFSAHYVHALLNDWYHMALQREWAQRLHPYMEPDDWTKLSGIVAGRLLQEGRYKEFVESLDPDTCAELTAALVGEEGSGFESDPLVVVPTWPPQDFRSN